MNTNKSKAFVQTLAAFAAATVVGALASAGSVSASETKHGHSEAAGIGQPGGKPSRTIEVVMHDNYFEPESFAVEHGETVKFKIKNAGEFVHEFNIGTAAMHAEHQQEMMMMVEHGVLEADKINHAAMMMKMPDGSTMEHNDPNSVLVEPGKTADVTWTFSGDADLEIACNVPGHYDSGMMASVHHK